MFQNSFSSSSFAAEPPHPPLPLHYTEALDLNAQTPALSAAVTIGWIWIFFCSQGSYLLILCFQPLWWWDDEYECWLLLRTKKYPGTLSKRSKTQKFASQLFMLCFRPLWWWDDSYTYWRRLRMMHVTHGWCTSHMDDARHTWMMHVTHAWCTSNMDDTRHTWMMHVTHGWCTSHMDDIRHTWMMHVTHGW